jgi:hypothetical protein
LDKAKNSKKTEDNEEEKNKESDYLAPILEQLNLHNTTLKYEQALEVKNLALKRLKERLLTRAEII